MKESKIKIRSFIFGIVAFLIGAVITISGTNKDYKARVKTAEANRVEHVINDQKLYDKTYAEVYKQQSKSRIFGKTDLNRADLNAAKQARAAATTIKLNPREYVAFLSPTFWSSLIGSLLFLISPLYVYAYFWVKTKIQLAEKMEEAKVEAERKLFDSID